MSKYSGVNSHSPIIVLPVIGDLVILEVRNQKWSLSNSAKCSLIMLIRESWTKFCDKWKSVFSTDVQIWFGNVTSTCCQNTVLILGMGDITVQPSGSLFSYSSHFYCNSKPLKENLPVKLVTVTQGVIRDSQFKILDMSKFPKDANGMLHSNWLFSIPTKFS